MPEVSYPVANGGAVTEYAYEKLFYGPMGEGRVDPEASAMFVAGIAYADSTGRHVKLRANQSAIVRGFRWESGTDGVVLPLDANTTGLPRQDLIVLRLDRQSYTVRGHIIKGSPASSPIAPAATRSTTETGTYDVVLGSVRVVSNATTGLPSIAAADVTTLEHRLAPRPRMGLSAVMRNYAHPHGTIWTELDAPHRVYAQTPNGKILLGEDGPWTALTAAAGWESVALFAQRRNGWTYIQGSVSLAGATALPANEVKLITTLPNDFRPDVDFSSIALVTPMQIGRIAIFASSGRLELRQFMSPLSASGGVVIQPLVFPSKGV